MITNSDLDKLLTSLKLTKEDYVFLTIKTVYLYEMKSGEKNVEYRTPGDFIFTRLYDDFKKKKFTEPKKVNYILFQAGYNPDSPRMLIELKGWNNQGENHPKTLNTDGHDMDRGSVNLLLGKILFENLDMSREEEYRRKEDREYAPRPKSKKAKAALQTKLKNRRSKIRKGDARKK